VLEVGGQPPEDFETIVRRYVAASPNVKRTLGAQLATVTRLLKAMLTPALDLEAYERARDVPHLSHASLAVNSADWRASHSWDDLSGPPEAADALQESRTAGRFAVTRAGPGSF
jgi:hypothetical protein